MNRFKVSHVNTAALEIYEEGNTITHHRLTRLPSENMVQDCDRGSHSMVMRSTRVCMAGTKFGANGLYVGDVTVYRFEKGHVEWNKEKKSTRHVGTMILIPPGQTMGGGDIVVRGKNHTKRLRHAAHEWAVAEIPIQTSFTIEPVTSGQLTFLEVPVYRFA